jgi:hypothetical protein
VTSCGSGEPDGDTWLIRLDDTTITVAQAGEAWTELSPPEQNFFLSRTNQFGEFIVSLSRKALIVAEIERLGYLDRPGLIALGDAWARRTGFYLGKAHIESIIEASISDEDVTYYMSKMGKTVWYTLSAGTPEETSIGPFHLPRLSRELAVHLDSMQVGEVLSLADGTPVRLDSVEMTDPELVAETLQDTSRVTSFARQELLNAWSSDMIDAVTDSILAEAAPEIRQDAVERLSAAYSGVSAFIEGDTLISSGLGVWTSSELVYEIEFMSMETLVKPDNATWTAWLVRRLLSVEALLSYINSVSPEALDSIERGRQSWMMSTASESLYTDSVSRLVEIAPGILRDEYDNLNELPVIPEMRSIQCIWIPIDKVDEYRIALYSGDVAQLVSEMVFFDYLSEDDPPSSITRPLLATEIPGGHDEAVFSLGTGDTIQWSEPLNLVEDYSFFAFRLVGVFPAHEAAFEEIEGELNMIIRTRLEEDRTNEWLHELEDRYELRINEEILSDLPADPALWQNL